ncbi:metallophosphoesterase [Chitinophaga nivalis]|uniref:Metallophosphoesterase n=1 Tax=Chitinophaga nivalis TaxID=2991709 RepID=A0ABT3IRF2_9BACT|nr:metallophosphoesterase [Chitinophaga nivalis]MCW3463752.1 metallophosphoesterase [Chitinophaga nivalis]MCW3486558.1 metallophosphoesterase [Chitinophaga nivalis]
MRPGINSIILVIFLLLLDIYVFQAIRAIVYTSAPRVRNITYSIYWVISLGTVAIILLLPYINWENWPPTFKSYVIALFMGLVVAKLLITVFLLVDDLRRVVLWLFRKIAGEKAPDTTAIADGISRSQFLNKLGLLAGGSFFATLMYGLSNKYNYRVHKIKLAFNHLPAAFKGLRIVQLSDIHSGSFANREAVLKGIELVNAQKPDLVLFTGDLVNNTADEMEPWMDVFSQVKAPMGVFSTLGNHDYGDYVFWPDKTPDGHSVMRQQNLERLKAVHGELGWKLMMNESVTLERGGEQIALLGVENWSAVKRFPRYGDLKRTYEGVSHIPFKILLSHDPTHWDAQVRPHYPDIALTLAGHTHGMQFGVEIPGFKWSPAQYFYKEWAGLYKEGMQHLYVNRGFGFLGYPGRVGVLPEITVIDLV